MFSLNHDPRTWKVDMQNGIVTMDNKMVDFQIVKQEITIQ